MPSPQGTGTGAASGSGLWLPDAPKEERQTSHLGSRVLHPRGALKEGWPYRRPGMSGMPTTVVLSVSAPTLDCGELVQLLARSGIDCSVTSNSSVVDGRIENGCRILSAVRTDAEVMELWGVTRTMPGVSCAHLAVPGRYYGCVANFPKVRCGEGSKG